jgi:hypothetical protein
MSFLREVFSDGGQGSASRVMMAFHAAVGAGAIGHVVYHTHAIPDAVTMAGVTAFVTAPYALNALHKAVGAFGGNGANPVAP